MSVACDVPRAFLEKFEPMQLVMLVFVYCVRVPKITQEIKEGCN